MLLGYHFAEELSDELGPGSELGVFLRWEQLAGYSRALVHKDFSFRGSERVRKNLSDNATVTISDDGVHQILGNQKIYGLWGLYTMPARASALVDGEPTRLTPPARALLESQYLPLLEQRGGGVVRRIRETLRSKSRRVATDGADSTMIHAIGRVLAPKLRARECEVFRAHLLHGGPKDPTAGRQRLLARLLEETLVEAEFCWSTERVTALAERAEQESDLGLGSRLRRIAFAEALLAPVSALFTHLLGLDGESSEVVSRRLHSAWGAGLCTVNAAELAKMRGDLGAGDSATGDRWVRIAEALSCGDYLAFLDALIEQNRVVMNARGGAPWLEKRGQSLHVRFRDEQGRLPERQDVPGLWRFPYFLDSLRMVASAVRER